MAVEVPERPRMIEVLHPVAQNRPVELPLAERVATLDGRVVGFLDNSKANVDVFLQRIEALLRERFQFETVYRRKVNAAVPAGEDLIKALRRRHQRLR
jgi:hypothetical protein